MALLGVQNPENDPPTKPRPKSSVPRNVGFKPPLPAAPDWAAIDKTRRVEDRPQFCVDCGADLNGKRYSKFDAFTGEEFVNSEELTCVKAPTHTRYVWTKEKGWVGFIPSAIPNGFSVTGWGHGTSNFTVPSSATFLVHPRED